MLTCVMFVIFGFFFFGLWNLKFHLICYLSVCTCLNIIVIIVKLIQTIPPVLTFHQFHVPTSSFFLPINWTQPRNDHFHLITHRRSIFQVKTHKKFQNKRRIKDMERSSGDSVTEDDEGKPEGVPLLPNHQEQHQSGIEADYESQDAGWGPQMGRAGRNPRGLRDHCPLTHQRWVVLSLAKV